jgi:hypothetical protein
MKGRTPLGAFMDGLKDLTKPSRKDSNKKAA